MKTTDLQDIIHTTIRDIINIGLNTLYSYVPVLIPDPETPMMFNGSIKNSFTLTSNSWTTNEKVVKTASDYQLDIRFSSDINSPKYVIAVHQTEARTGVPNKTNNISIFDQLDFREFFVKMNGARCPRGDAIDLYYRSKDYLNQKRDLKAFLREYLGEPILNPFLDVILIWKNSTLVRLLAYGFKSIM